jgi:hypothetical protein
MQQTRQTMGEIFDAMRLLLPLSLDDERFGDPARRAEILAAMNRLAADAATLDSHGSDRDPGFSFLSHSLADQSGDIRDRFERGRVDEARFLLHAMTQTCVACHSRLASKRASSLASRFVLEKDIAALPLDERAKLEVATRQFDSAAETYAALFASPDSSPADLDRQGHFDDYLELCIRVLEDYRAPTAVLDRVAARGDVADPLRSNLRGWIDALRTVPTLDAGSPPRQRATLLLKRAEEVSRFPNERIALVYYFAASSLLNRYVNERPPEGRGVAEAYYLLGTIESRVGRSFWVSQTEPFLEAAIRLAPSEPFAEQAYALLEEFLVSGYTGSAGTNVPPEVKRRLLALRALIDGS